MKIAIIAPTEIPALRANTVQVMKMTQAFISNGHDARLVSPLTHPHTTQKNHGGEEVNRYSWDELALQYGLQYRFPIEWIPARRYFRRYDYSLSAVRWARNWEADLIYTRLPQAAAIASQIKTRTILEVHDLPQGKMGTRLFRLFLQGGGAQRLVVITYALAEDLINTFQIPQPKPTYQDTNTKSTFSRKEFTLIAPDGVDLERYDNLPSTSDARKTIMTNTDFYLPKEDFIAGYTGHLYTGRGTKMLLSLAEYLPQVTFLLVGGEPKQVKLFHEQIKHRGLKNVILTGFIPNAELPLYQAACDILLMPYQRRIAASSGGDISRYLSPMKLFEYMACERAILSSDLPVLKEIISNENATLLPTDNINAWVDAIKNMMTNPAQRKKLATQARQDVQQYSWDARAERILNGLEL
jgi:glycosyltransferase involved in cell wall biosynthesis